MRQSDFLYFTHCLVVEIKNVFFVFAVLMRHCRARVAVQKPCEHVRIVEAPAELFAQRFDVVLYAFENGAEHILWVMQKSD